MSELVRRHAPERTRLHVRLHHLADERRIGALADHPQRFGRAALHDRIGILQRHLEHGARRRLADQSERERSHLPHLAVGIGEER